MELTVEQYYKVKAAALELQLVQLKLEQQFAIAKQKHDVALHEAGLQPHASYRLIDETHSVEEVLPQPSKI